jgi:pentatricopeptide repeat protein
MAMFKLGKGEGRGQGKGKGKGTRSDNIVILSRKTLVRFAKNGAATQDHRMQVKLLTKAGVRGWQFFSAAWSPWYEKRPRITARIRTPAGETHVLDVSTIAVETARSGHWATLTDRRRLRAPLPGLVVGAIIDLRVVMQEKRPRLGSGDVHRVALAPVMPTRLHHLTVEAPVSLPLKWRLRGLSMKPRSDSTSGGVRRVVFVAGPFEKNPLWEPNLPPEAPRFPHLQISTVKSWRDVASTYLAMVKSRLRNPNAAAVVRNLRRSGATGRDRLIAGLLLRLRKQIRYVALALGVGAIKPRLPAVTLRRRYGDCKDMSALLVSWLRAAGIRAHLALVNTVGADLLPGLPGLSAFNHAIVYIPGKEPLWIDPTARYSAPDATPFYLQNRWALIIRPGTSGLTRIPASKAADNVYQEIREVIFSPEIGGRIVERTHATGAFAKRVRSMVGGQDAATLRKSMKSYIRKTYVSDKLVSIRHGSVNRLSGPFSFRLEMGRADVAWTDDHQAKLTLNSTILWSDVPAYLRAPPKPGSGRLKRKRDLYWGVPHVAKLVYRIAGPPEYVLATRPRDGSYQLGPARISWRVKHDPKTGRLEIAYTLNTGARRYSPADVKAFWSGMRRFTRLVKIKSVIYEHRGRRLHKEGKYRAALAVYRGLVNRFPKMSAYYRQLANFYSDIGFGQKARKVLRDAVVRLPNNPVVHYTLGRHLELDEYGKRTLLGWDRKSTIAAYRRAQRLDPKNVFYPRALGRVLSVDARGRDLTTASALKPALDVLLAMRKKLKDTTMDKRIARLLLYARRHGELRTHLRHLSKGRYRASMEVSNIAVQKGYSAGLEHARRLAPQGRDFKALTGAAGAEIVRLGEYKLALRFIALGIGDSLQERARALSVKRVRSMAHLVKPPKTAKSAALRLLYFAFTGGLTKKIYDAIVSGRLVGAGRKKLFTFLTAIGRSTARKSDYPPLVAADMMVSQLRTKVEGNDGQGYRVELRIEGRSAKTTVYVIKSGGQYRVRATGFVRSEIGVEGLYLLGRRRTAHARQWLDWARGRDEASSDPLRGSPFDQYYVAGKKVSGRRLRVAAALLVSGSETARKGALKVLERGLRSRPSRRDRIQLERGVMAVYAKEGRWSKASRYFRKMWKLSGKKRRYYLIYVNALVRAKKLREASRVARKWQKEEPTRWAPYVALAEVALYRGRFAESTKQLERASTTANAPASVYNTQAWNALFIQPLAVKKAIVQAIQGVRLSNYRAGHILHTLATLYAEAGQLHSARLALAKCLEVQKDAQPEGSSLYTYGRIAEQLGFVQVALASYRKVKKPKHLGKTSTWLLVQRRLQILSGRKGGRPVNKR